MSKNRRDFLKHSARSASGLPLLAALTSLGLPSSLLAQQTARQEEEFDQATFDFWTSQVRKPSEDFLTKGIVTKAASDTPEFVYYDPKGVFYPASDIPIKNLPDKGGVRVSFRVQGFRPSNTNIDQFNNLQSGSLRVDVKQTEPLPSLAEVLAWSAVAALVPKADGKLPALQDLEFRPGESWGRLQEIPLTNGLGFWSWNFFLKKKESVWGKLMKAFRVANKTVFPLLGFPAIAVTALTAVDRVVARPSEPPETSHRLVDTFQGHTKFISETQQRCHEIAGLLPFTFQPCEYWPSRVTLIFNNDTVKHNFVWPSKRQAAQRYQGHAPFRITRLQLIPRLIERINTRCRQ